MRSSKPGKTTSAKPEGKRPSDPIDKLIIEEGLRIKDIYIRKDLDILMVVLNNGGTIRSTVSGHARLKGAKQGALEKWSLIAGGRGVHWEALDEDLSLRGFIVEHAMRNAIEELTAPHGRAIRA
jgi:hypothetical protein